VKQVLVYSDSLSWGIIPGTRERQLFEHRWPGVLEGRLNAEHEATRVIEDCLNGRRTVWEDPFKAGRRGIDGLAQVVEAQSPLALVILMLGTNDFQSMHPHSVWHASQGMAALIQAVRGAPIEPGMPSPPILVIAPPPITKPRGPIAPKFLGGAAKCEGLAGEYREVSRELGCTFFDAGRIVTASEVDGVHLGRSAHQELGRVLAPLVADLIREPA
jgi:lysophospholipase L1-like esterase